MNDVTVGQSAPRTTKAAAGRRTKVTNPPPAEMILGWREWLALPGLGIVHIKAKLDTGARSSAINGEVMERFRRQGADYVRLALRPAARQHDPVLVVAKLIDTRWVSDSGGHKEWRPFISTPLLVGNEEWPIEISVANRPNMKFNMLLGRTAMQGRVAVDPNRSYVLGRPPKEVRRPRKATTKVKKEP